MDTEPRVRAGRAELLLGDTDQYAALGATPHEGQPGLDLARGKVITLQAAAGHEERVAVFFGVHPAADGSALITVADTGAGIPASELPHLFERFHRVPGSDGGGSGLGLAIVREIALNHGARVLLEAPKGGGTRVTLCFPATPGQS